MSSIPFDFAMALMTFITVVLGAVAVIAVVNESSARRKQDIDQAKNEWNERRFNSYSERLERLSQLRGVTQALGRPLNYYENRHDVIEREKAYGTAYAIISSFPQKKVNELASGILQIPAEGSQASKGYALKNHLIDLAIREIGTILDEMMKEGSKVPKTEGFEE